MAGSHTGSRTSPAVARRCQTTSRRGSERGPLMPAGALERAVELLGRLGDTGPELTVAQLAADAGMPTSTAYRLLAELEQYGLVQRSSDRTVALGTRLGGLGGVGGGGVGGGVRD